MRSRRMPIASAADCRSSNGQRAARAAEVGAGDVGVGVVTLLGTLDVEAVGPRSDEPDVQAEQAMSSSVASKPIARRTSSRYRGAGGCQDEVVTTDSPSPFRSGFCCF